MSSFPSIPGRAPTHPGVLALPWQLAHWFGSLFEIREPAERTRALTFVMLTAIVIAGAALRFWGLGDISLHGDEETMAMPTMHIVRDGHAVLPSGMFYPRGIAQLYMMAASVMAFGQSEWSLRLPSVICGIVLIVVAFYAGRRFLSPTWNLAFTAAVALLPELIVDAQTARMYTFLVTCVTGYMILLFRWERTDNAWFLAGAVATLIIGIQFQTLAVFAAFMAFYPGLVRGELHKIVYGAAAFAAIIAGFMAIDHWVGLAYPSSREVGGEEEVGSPRAASAIPQVALWMFAVAAVGAAAVAAFAVRQVHEKGAAITAAALMALGLLAQVAFSYHVAALLMIAGAVIAMRSGQLTVARVLPLATICAALLVGQFYLVHANGAKAPHQILGAMLGWPSIWPQFVVAKYSIAAGVFAALGLVGGLWCLARRKPVPDFVLLLVLGVWIPLIAIGFFRWNVALRYTAVQTIPLLIGGFAAAQWFFESRRRPLGAPSQAAVAAIACVLVVNPIAFAATVHAGYRLNPDHQGAAMFIRSVKPGPRDIVIAEDVLEQTYYLGHVDYWLEDLKVAAPFVINVNGVWTDFYTNTPLIGSAEELQKLIDKPDRGAIYVIGSGENQEDGRRYMRGDAMANMLESHRFTVVYRGRDSLTEVLKIPAPGATD